MDVPKDKVRGGAGRSVSRKHAVQQVHSANELAFFFYAA